MSDHRLTTLTALTATALVLVIGAGALAGSSSASADLAPRVEQALATSGLEDVQVDVSGREVSVRDGTLRELTEAAEIAEQVPGVRRAAVDDRPGSVDRLDTTRPYLRLRRDPGRLRILGSVPTAAAAATVKSSAARAFGVPVRGDLVIDPSLPSAAWIRELPNAFDALTAISDMELTVDGQTLELTGSIDTTMARDDLLRTIRQALPSLAVAANIQVVRIERTVS